MWITKFAEDNDSHFSTWNNFSDRRCNVVKLRHIYTLIIYATVFNIYSIAKNEIKVKISNLPSRCTPHFRIQDSTGSIEFVHIRFVLKSIWGRPSSTFGKYRLAVYTPLYFLFLTEKGPNNKANIQTFHDTDGYIEYIACAF